MFFVYIYIYINENKDHMVSAIFVKFHIQPEPVEQTSQRKRHNKLEIINTAHLRIQHSTHSRPSPPPHNAINLHIPAQR